jgi:hypothetical protein
MAEQKANLIGLEMVKAYFEMKKPKYYQLYTGVNTNNIPTIYNYEDDAINGQEQLYSCLEMFNKDESNINVYTLIIFDKYDNDLKKGIKPVNPQQQTFRLYERKPYNWKAENNISSAGQQPIVLHSEKQVAMPASNSDFLNYLKTENITLKEKVMALEAQIRDLENYIEKLEDDLIENAEDEAEEQQEAEPTTIGGVFAKILNSEPMQQLIPIAVAGLMQKFMPETKPQENANANQ